MAVAQSSGQPSSVVVVAMVVPPQARFPASDVRGPSVTDLFLRVPGSPPATEFYDMATPRPVEAADDEHAVVAAQLEAEQEEAKRLRGLAVAATNMYWNLVGSSYDARGWLATARNNILQMQQCLDRACSATGPCTLQVLQQVRGRCQRECSGPRFQAAPPGRGSPDDGHVGSGRGSSSCCVLDFPPAGGCRVRRRFGAVALVDQPCPLPTPQAQPVPEFLGISPVGQLQEMPVGTTPPEHGPPLAATQCGLAPSRRRVLCRASPRCSRWRVPAFRCRSRALPQGLRHRFRRSRSRRRWRLGGCRHRPCCRREPVGRAMPLGALGRSGARGRACRGS